MIKCTKKLIKLETNNDYMMYFKLSLVHKKEFPGVVNVFISILLGMRGRKVNVCIKI